MYCINPGACTAEFRSEHMGQYIPNYSAFAVEVKPISYEHLL
jgi:hypothetical protein